MFTVGLTGGVAAGKSTATNFFIDKGITVVDADLISRNLQIQGEEGYKQIVKKFSDDILDNNSEIDRKKIREIAFSDPKNKKWLEDLMHQIFQPFFIFWIAKSYFTNFFSINLAVVVQDVIGEFFDNLLVSLFALYL